MSRIYACIDLKSFYASVECVKRNLNPLDTNLVVADSTRTEKTICLAVSPSLKQYGLPGRARLYEVMQKIKEINKIRLKDNNYHKFTSKSYLDSELKSNKNLELDLIIASPNMKLYIDYSTKIYDVYLKYLSKEDIYVYSIDEVFCDITDYLDTYKLSKEELVTKIIKDIYDTTGITATGGIGTNMYLCKIAMDIVAKHTKPNSYGVRMASLDEMSYRKLLWSHVPLTDFWRVGKGYATKLNEHNIYTMGDIALCSINNEDLLYDLFGINAELLIDHAWGYESCTMKDIKSYKPSNNSISSGQVLHCPYNYNDTKIIIKEMTDSLILDLVKKNLVTDSVALVIDYDINNKEYNGTLTLDHYGRKVPKPSNGRINLDYKTSSQEIIIPKIIELYNKIVNKSLLIKRVTIVFNNLEKASKINNKKIYKQINLFNINKVNEINEISRLKEENKLNKTVIELKEKYGKNAVLKGINLLECSTMVERNNQIGGHKA
mgnify:FL=1